MIQVQVQVQADCSRMVQKNNQHQESHQRETVHDKFVIFAKKNAFLHRPALCMQGWHYGKSLEGGGGGAKEP